MLYIYIKSQRKHAATYANSKNLVKDKVLRDKTYETARTVLDRCFELANKPDNKPNKLWVIQCTCKKMIS